MKKLQCVISAFSKAPVFDFNYNELQKTASALDYELEFITIAPKSVKVDSATSKVKYFDDSYTG